MKENMGNFKLNFSIEVPREISYYLNTERDVSTRQFALGVGENWGYVGTGKLILFYLVTS